MTYANKLFSLVCFFICIHVALFPDSWAESTLKKMSIEEKVGQLFMVAGYVDEGYAQRELQKTKPLQTDEVQKDVILQMIEEQIVKYHLGGVGLVGPSSAEKQVTLLNRYQAKSKYPLLIAQDFEWGLSMRLTDGMRFPKNATLGAVVDNSLIYEMGKEIARQARLVGVHMNLSPDLDVNIEPENPVINVRSFGACPKIVALKGVQMIRGLQDGGVIASAKHFPGLGDIVTDSHLDLPVNACNKERLEKVELYPFLQAIGAGVLSIQTDHIYMPALESEELLPSSLSSNIVEKILKQEMGFTGLVLSGALRMQALTNRYGAEEIALKAFFAGSDMLLMPEDLPRSYQAIKQAVLDQKISEQALNQRVLKILRLKELVGLDRARLVDMPTKQSLNTSYAKDLKKKLFSSAVAIERNDQKCIPIKQKDKQRILYVQVGDAPSNAFFEAMKNHASIDPIFLDLECINSQEIAAQAEKYSKVILALFPANPRRIVEIRLMNKDTLHQELKDFRVHGVTTGLQGLLTAFKAQEKKTVVAYFGNSFGCHFLEGFSSMIMAHEDDEDAQEAAASLLCGRAA